MNTTYGLGNNTSPARIYLKRLIMKLKYLGQRYVGADIDIEVIASHGEIVTVSEAKAHQLLTDFPDDWELVETAKRTKPAGPNRRK